MKNMVYDMVKKILALSFAKLANFFETLPYSFLSLIIDFFKNFRIL